MEPAGPQLVLDLPFSEGMSLADFMPAPSNRTALDLVLRWPDWPCPVVLIEGPEGCGKSHLARIWAVRAAAPVLTAGELPQPGELRARTGDARAVVVEDADRDPDESALFHLFNLILERRGYLLLTARRPLAAWNLRLADLRSRLATALPVQVAPPDEQLLAALLVKQFADRQVRVEPGAIAYIVARMERSFAAARRLVAALDTAAFSQQRTIGQALARRVLDQLAQMGPSRPQQSGDLCEPIGSHGEKEQRAWISG